MQQQSIIRPKNDRLSAGFLLLTFLVLSCFFLFLQMLYFYLLNTPFISNALVVTQGLMIPQAMLLNLIYFFFAQMVSWVIFSGAVWIASLLLIRLFKLQSHAALKAALGLWVLAICTVLLANQFYFPGSQFSTLLTVSVVVTKWLFYLMAGLLLFASLLAVLSFIGLIRHNVLATGLSFAVLGLVLVMFYPRQQPVVQAYTGAKPNIIFISIDSLRPDMLRFLGNKSAPATPAVSRFLQQATVFSNTLTPIARSFPSWMSILTGQYPRQTGARFNLTDPASLQLKSLLPKILQQAGYTTMYATDENRFSNLTQRYGFDTVIGPKMGALEFLLGTINDFPLSNLLINTRLGRCLFPYNYANRASFINYKPQTFTHLFAQHLQGLPNKPLFLAMQLSLAHWPYIWAPHQGIPTSTAETQAKYRVALPAVDKQFAAIMQLLKQHKLLENSIFVLLSDHGEGLELPGDLVITTSKYINGVKPHKNVINQVAPAHQSSADYLLAAGHGTNVLSLKEFQPVMAFRLYGKTKNVAKVIGQRVSLLDIKPTVLELLNLSIPDVAGISLKPLLENKKLQLATRAFYLESAFTLPAIKTTHPDLEKTLAQGAGYYRIDAKTGHLMVKADKAKLIISSKQFAIIQGNWMLAFFPLPKQQYLKILVNLKTGEWTDKLKSAFAQQAKVNVLLRGLQSFGFIKSTVQE